MANHPIKELPPEWIREALRGQRDILGEELRREQEIFSRAVCGRCGSDVLYPTLDVRRPLREGDILFRRLLKCGECGAITEPYTQITIEGEKEK